MLCKFLQCLSVCLSVCDIFVIMVTPPSILAKTKNDHTKAKEKQMKEGKDGEIKEETRK